MSLSTTALRIPWKNTSSGLGKVTLYASLHFKASKPEKSRVELSPLRDRSIPHSTVVVLDEENGQLGKPQNLTDVLSSTDRRAYFVELVSEPKFTASKFSSGFPGSHANTATAQKFAVVKIVSREARHQALKSVPSRAVIPQKEIQLTWGVSESDLGHKIKKVKQELEKGSLVDLVYAPKAGAQLPVLAERNQRLDDAVRKLSDVAKERKPRQIKGRVAVLSFQHLSIPPGTRKEVRLAWGASHAEFKYAMDKVVRELEKGYFVNLVFEPKTVAHLPIPLERQIRLEKTVEMLADIAKERRPRCIKGGDAVLSFQHLTDPPGSCQRRFKLSWGVSDDDLGVTLNEIKKELEMGTLVDLVYTQKTVAQLPTPAERQERLEATVRSLRNVAKEWRPKQVDDHVAVISFRSIRNAGLA
jgi:translation initiation factor IF-3